MAVVPISVLLTFNRLKALTEDPKEVAKALLQSDSVQLSEDGTKVRRSRPLPLVDDSKERTVYLKGFPRDTTLDELFDWFDSLEGDARRYARVVMRKDRDKSFKGSIFAEMKEKKDAHALVAAHENAQKEGGSGGLLFRDKPLEKVLLRDDYYQAKKEERRAAEAAAVEEEDRALKAEFKKELTPGVIVKFSKLPNSVNWPSLQDACDKVSSVRFTELDEKQNDVAFMRFADAEGAATLKRAVDTLRTTVEEGGEKSEVQETLLQGFGGIVPEATVLEGDEERQYWERIWEAQLARVRARRLQKKPAAAGGGSGGAKKGAAKKRGRGGGKGEGKDEDGDGDEEGAGEEPAAKRAATAGNGDGSAAPEAEKAE